MDEGDEDDEDDEEGEGEEEEYHQDRPKRSHKPVDRYIPPR
jgi:hypothetical protein